MVGSRTEVVARLLADWCAVRCRDLGIGCGCGLALPHVDGLSLSINVRNERTIDNWAKALRATILMGWISLASESLTIVASASF
jgi:hypothetical protein